jgi:GNAT superfamily N-acetyltransferase
LRTEHCEAVGKPDTFNIPLARTLMAHTPTFIMTARCDGRMVGYLVMIVGATIVAEGMVSAVSAPFYVRPEHRGRVGVRLLDAAVAECWARGADDILLYAGVAGDGPRLGTLYLRHLGAEPCGSLYRLTREN